MAAPEPDRAQRWRERIARRRGRVAAHTSLVVQGRLTRMVGLTLEAAGCIAPVGARCRVLGRDGGSVEAEVVGFAGERLYLMPEGQVHGLMPDSRVLPTGGVAQVPVGDELLGRVLDGAGRVLDGRPPPRHTQRVALQNAPINPLLRGPIREPLDVGVRAINGLLTVGRGQRMGLFAGSGVGKSVLLGMMTRFTEADVIVVGLIGERGREVQEFIHQNLGEAGLARAVVVAAPSDTTPLARLHGAALATRIAEHFRDAGKQVLLLMDSLTRYAQAQRELGLAIGEPPATKGYPPSVFARMPQLVERAGNGAEDGSITAFYTVLTESDDRNDPIADAARAILDGHVVLTRALAEAGQFPAIDLEASVSRSMPQIARPEQLELARRFRRLNTDYEQHRDLISIGAYAEGSNPAVDEAVRYRPALQRFLIQGMDQRVDLEASLDGLAQALGEPRGGD